MHIWLRAGRGRRSYYGRLGLECFFGLSGWILGPYSRDDRHIKRVEHIKLGRDLSCIARADGEHSHPCSHGRPGQSFNAVRVVRGVQAACRNRCPDGPESAEAKKTYIVDEVRHIPLNISYRNSLSLRATRAQILGVKGAVRKKYLVSWEGYSTNENTWEPAGNLPTHLVSEFNKSQAPRPVQMCRDGGEGADEDGGGDGDGGGNGEGGSDADEDTDEDGVGVEADPGDSENMEEPWFKYVTQVISCDIVCALF